MNQISRCQPFLGTFVEVNISADCDDELLIKASDKAFSMVQKVHQKMSFHNPNSELSYINSNAHQHPIELSKELYEVLSMAQVLHQKSDGSFDVSVAPWLVKDGYLPNNFQPEDMSPVIQSSTDLTAMQLQEKQVYFRRPLLLDLGGIAKGYAVDQAMQVIVEELQRGLPGALEQASVNAGGDLKVYNWQDFVTLIPNKNKTMRAIPMINAAVASSSGYYLAGNSAIYDVTTGKQVDIPATVSIFTDQCMVADALTKVAALKGVDDPIFAHYNADVIFT